MRKIRTIPIFAVLAFVISFSVPEVYATPLITLSSSNSPVCCTVTILGTGFIAEEGLTVFIFVDGTYSDSVSVVSDGTFNITFPIAPGFHTISISADVNNPTITLLASQTITVTPSSTSIPEFPFSFSLVIIFVAVAAVYLVIRQKMTTNFRPF